MWYSRQGWGFNVCVNLIWHICYCCQKVHMSTSFTMLPHPLTPLVAVITLDKCIKRKAWFPQKPENIQHLQHHAVLCRSLCSFIFRPYLYFSSVWHWQKLIAFALVTMCCRSSALRQNIITKHHFESGVASICYCHVAILDIFWRKEIQKDLFYMGLHSHRPVRVSMLNCILHRKWQQWAHQHQNWTTEQWKKVAWFD